MKNKHLISRTLVATMVVVFLAGSGSAWADRKNDQRGYGHSQGGQYDKRDPGRRGHSDKRAYGRKQDSHRDRRSHARGNGGQYDKHYAYNKHRKNKQKRHHYKDSYKPRHYRGRGGNTYYYEDDDSDDKLLIGLLMGGLIGYAINSSQGDSYEYDSYPQSGTQRNPQSATYAGGSYSDGTCLQEREYQTTVTVGGRTVDAYGTACLQPDGSWSRSPARTESF